MKKIILLAITALSAFGADTNTIRVFTTNYVAAASNYRDVDGQLYNVDFSVKWETKRCYFNELLEQGALMAEITKVVDHIGRSAIDAPGMPAYQPFYKQVPGQKFLVKDFTPPQGMISGDTAELRVLRIGQTNFNGEILPLYDFGTPHMIPVVTSKAQLEADQEKATATKKHAADVALKSNQDAAAKGDAYGLLRMGERYRDGDGVEKDLAKAREYLQKSADAGSPTAAEELSKLKP
ncbi:MAG: tetratricopeptide repeat protein [Limisphaerales bacterium]